MESGYIGGWIKVKLVEGRYFDPHKCLRPQRVREGEREYTRGP